METHHKNPGKNIRVWSRVCIVEYDRYGTGSKIGATQREIIREDMADDEPLTSLVKDTALVHCVLRLFPAQLIVLVYHRAERSFLCRQKHCRWFPMLATKCPLKLAQTSIHSVSSQSQGKAFFARVQIVTELFTLHKLDIFLATAYIFCSHTLHPLSLPIPSS